MPSQLNETRTFDRIGAEECWLLVGSEGVGRVGFMGATNIQIVPTRYDAQRGTAYFRAGTFGELARRVHGRAVTLQVDDIDHANFSGWSVVMTGTAHRVDDAATVAARWSAGRPSPWLPTPQAQWIALDVDEITGERVSP